MSETIFQTITKVAERSPDAVAIMAYGRSLLSYSGLVKQVNATVSTFNTHGVGRNDRVMIVLPNGPELALACLSVMAGAVAVPINPDSKQPEIEEFIDRIAPTLLILEAGSGHVARAAAMSKGLLVAEIQVSRSAAAGEFSLNWTDSNRDIKPNADGHANLEDTALILQTSGTTSHPKIVPLTQANLAASTHNLVGSLNLSFQDRVLHFLPMFHIGGIVDVLVAPLVSGGSVICATSFSVPEFYRDLKEYKPTWAQAVPVMLRAMLEGRNDHLDPKEVLSLRFVRSVSAPLAVDLMEAFERAFNIPVIEIFGMTETAGVITSNPLPPAKRKPGSVGIAAGVNVMITHENGQRVPADQIGRVVVEGPNVMSGYEGDPVENKNAIRSDGFHTGDLGYLDLDGYLYLTGRIKDIINRGGEKVTPQEVDRVLLSHPDIADAATFPIPHPTLGEDVGAAIVLNKGAQLSKVDLLDWLRERLAFFKIPQRLLIIDSIPRKNGKLQRSTMTELYGHEEIAEGDRPAYVEPKSPVAKTLAKLWSAILKIDPIGMEDDFFKLGGDSLRAASFINTLQQQFGDTIYVSSIFDAPTLGRYEQFLRKQYPELIARMLGQLVAPSQILAPKVTPKMIASMESMIPRPLIPGFLPSKKNPRAIFVLSTPRSGSTLFRSMLAGHPQMFAPPELYLLGYENLADRKNWFSGSQSSQLEGNIRALMEIRGETAEQCQALMQGLEQRACSTQDYYLLLQEWLDDRILIDKTPAYAIDINALNRIEAYFENPVYIYLQRHPYGMIRSFDEARLDQLWFQRIMSPESYDLENLPFDRRQLAEMIWLVIHRNIIEFLKKVPQERQFSMHFEDLVSAPEKAMRKICDAVGLDYTPAMLEPQKNKKQRMTDGIHEISRMIGDPKFHTFDKIESSVADQWKLAYEIDFLCDETLSLAASMGYTETVNSVRGRTEIEI